MKHQIILNISQGVYSNTSIFLTLKNITIKIKHFPNFRDKDLKPTTSTFVHTHINVTGHDGDVLEIQSGVDLVHEVERRGFVVVQREHQSQGAEGLLSS